MADFEGNNYEKQVGQPEIEDKGENILHYINEFKDIPDADSTLGSRLNNNDIPDNVDYAVEMNNLFSVIKKLEEFAKGITNENEKKCVQDCIDKKFKPVLEKIPKLHSGEIPVEKFMENFQLAIMEGKSEKDDGEKLKWGKTMSDETKMMLIMTYKETIFPLLGIDKFYDSSKTLGDGVVDDQFIDNKPYSKNFELSEKFDKETQGKEIGQGLLRAIAQIEGRITEGENKLQNQNIRKILEKEISKIIDNDERQIAQELWLSINEKLGGDDDLRVSMEDRAYLFAQSMIFMGEYRIARPDITPIDLYQLLNSNQNKLLHQHLWDVNTITSSDHGIKHILRGDLTLAENVFDQITPDQWKKLYKQNNEQREPNEAELAQFQARLRVLTMQATMDHDFGYTNVVNRMFDESGYEKAYYMQSDHPLWSTAYIQDNQERYEKYFGDKGYETLIKTIPGHGNAQTEYFGKIYSGTAENDEFVMGILSTTDCAGATGDYKISYMFAQKEIIGSLFNVYDFILDDDIESVKQGFRNLSQTIDSMPGGELKDSWLNGLQAFLKNGKFEKMDMGALKNTFTFYFEKFLGAYGVKTSIDSKTGNPECGIDEENGGWRVSFELAGKSFEYIYDSFGADIALKPFISVCGDYGISKKGDTIASLKQIINSAGEKRKNSHKNEPLSKYINDEFNAVFNSTTSELKLDGMEKIDNGVILKGPNNASITLKFDGKGYEGFDNSIDKINTINKNVDEMLKLLEKAENGSPLQINTIICNLQAKLADLGSFFDSNDFVGYEDLLDEISRSIVNLDSDIANIDDIKNQVQQIRTAYRFQLTDVGSSNPNLKN